MKADWCLGRHWPSGWRVFGWVPGQVRPLEFECLEELTFDLSDSRGYTPSLGWTPGVQGSDLVLTI